MSKTLWSSFTKCMMHLSSTCMPNERIQVQAYLRQCENLLASNVIKTYPRLIPSSIDILASCPHHLSFATAVCMPCSCDSNKGNGGGAQRCDCERGGGCSGTKRCGVKWRELSWPAQCTPGRTHTRRDYSLCCCCACAVDWTGGQRHFIMNHHAVV